MLNSLVYTELLEWRFVLSLNSWCLAQESINTCYISKKEQCILTRIITPKGGGWGVVTEARNKY